MRNFLFMLFAAMLLQPQASNAQLDHYRSKLNDPGLPAFVKAMCQPKANVQEVTNLYEQYYAEVIAPQKAAHKANPATANLKFKHEFEHLFKVWHIQTQQYITPDGYVDYSPEADRQRRAVIDRIHPKSAVPAPENNSWTPVGPMEVVSSDNNTPISWQANVWDFYRSNQFPNVLVAGTESGGAFRSVDAGKNWTPIGKDQSFRNVDAVAYWPWNPAFIRIAVPGKIMFSDDAGVTWQQCPTDANGGTISPDFQTFEILFCSNFEKNQQRVYAATSDGLLISNDYGKSWKKNRILNDNGTRITSIVEHATNPAKLYVLLYQPRTKTTTMLRSSNYGDTWQFIVNTGWFQVSAQGKDTVDVWGGRIAVTPADTNRMYVLLNGFSTARSSLQVDGFIGVYQSDNAGFTWTRKTGTIGRPHNPNTKPNLMSFPFLLGGETEYKYNQVTYLNNSLAVSTINKDRLLIGSLALWESLDAGATWKTRGGYFGDVSNIHPDVRVMSFRKIGAATEELFWCSDGGLNFTPDGDLKNHVARNRGIFANHLWGFEADKRLTLMGGGSYHNGNNYYTDGYPAGIWKHEGGAEAATGFIQYGTKPRLWFTEFPPYASNPAATLNDKNTAYRTILDKPEWRPNAPINLDYYEGSRVLFDRSDAKIIYWGNKGRFIRSTDDGQTAEVLADFGANQFVAWINESYTGILSAIVRNTADNTRQLQQSKDKGRTWKTQRLPSAQGRFLVVSGSDEYLFCANRDGANGNKVWYRIKEGDPWVNITTPALNGLTIRSILYIEGLVNHTFIATEAGGVFNYNLTTNQWDNISQGLNPGTIPLRLSVNYKTQKLQLGCDGNGVWERDLVSNPPGFFLLSVEAASEFNNSHCLGEGVTFFNRSNSSAQSAYSWSFPGGTPSTSTDENPVVRYMNAGTYPVTLAIADNSKGRILARTQSNFITIVGKEAQSYVETFSSGNFNPGWTVTDVNGNGHTWKVNNATKSMFAANFSINESGSGDKALTRKFDLSGAAGASLNFDVAYAMNANKPQVRDSLIIEVSKDCGKTFTRLFANGGAGLATKSPVSTEFIPATTDWSRKNIDLSAYVGQSELMFQFLGKGYGGNNLYIDNISVVTGSVGTGESSIFQSLLVSPNPSSGSFRVQFDLTKSFDGNMELTDPLGRSVYQTQVQSGAGRFEHVIQLQGLPSGLYLLRLNGRNAALAHKILIQ